MQKECRRAIFTYEQSDDSLIDELAAYLDDDKNILPIYDFFEVEQPTEKIEIEIVPTKKEYDEKYNILDNRPAKQKVEKWNIGCFNRRENKILYLSLNDYKNTAHAFAPEKYAEMLSHYKKTIVHEYTHFVTQLFANKHNSGWRPKWLSEGIAIYLSHQKDHLKLDFNYTLDEISNGTVHYNAYYLLTKYQIENYDKEFVFKLLESNREANEFLQNELYDKVKAYYNNENT